MKYDEASKMAAPPRKKGPAKESMAVPAEKLEKIEDTEGTGRKKHHKNHKKVAARKKGGAKKDMMMDENISGGGRKKGSAKHHGNMPPKKGSGDHKDGHEGGAKHYGKDHGTGDHKEGHKGGGKKKGAADFPKTGTQEHMASVKHSESGEHLGAKKAGAAMGFTQNFGPARQNSYARGAAKVAKIMGYPGAGDAQGGKPHTHSGVEIGSGATNELEGVTLSPKKNQATKIYQGTDIRKRLPDTKIMVPSSSGPKPAIKKNYGTSNFGTTFSDVNQLKQGGFLKVPRNSGYSSGNPQNQSDRINMLNEFTNFMKQPTSSPRRVTQKLNEMKSGPKGGLMSDIKFYGGGKKKHGKKHHNKK